MRELVDVFDSVVQRGLAGDVLVVNAFCPCQEVVDSFIRSLAACPVNWSLPFIVFTVDVDAPHLEVSYWVYKICFGRKMNW